MSEGGVERIKQGEQCPNCETDISITGNGCNVEVVENGRLVELKRRCYSCGNEWSIDTGAERGGPDE